MIDEALQFALDYCQENLTPEETVRRGGAIVQAIHGRLGELEDKEGMTTLVLGGVLKKLKENDLWKQIPECQDWWTWGDFCQKMTGRSSQTCYFKMKIWERWQHVGENHSPQLVDEIGWSGAAAILREAKTTEDFDQLVARYKELGSREKFTQEMKEKDDAKPPAERTEKRRYIRLGPTEKEFYLETLQKGIEKMGRENARDEEALLFIMAQWRESLSWGEK